MDSVHKLLNIVLPLISLFLLFFFLPAILLFKIFNSISRSVFSENVSSKIVLITGASSGIGEHLAYEYAKGGACLVLVARREKQLQEVACKARRLGSPDVIVETGDVSKVEDCKRFVDAALNHFGKLNHVVNNAGIAPLCLFEDADNVEDFTPIMNTNFWGSVYCTRFAIPHLRKSRGKIIVIASIAQWSPIPRLSIYSAGMDGFPVESTEGCTKAIFKSICRGDRYLFEPAWERTIYFWNLLCPEVIESFSRWRLLGRPNNSKSNRNSGAFKSD
ncbi:11-beta-hydroxysteroid dehydrogenase 1A-like isoform X2 [Rhododendron vialii]|uniref:11-beta-hydroxysteroid dehydrogenase 1A-like isoform X2 n=1 Tax=Rhododendron vialii TaxID=182163 RepID=UPI00265FDB01|nr:11-beta-hydroxysteroid dehydrogenase 1A-like isoform X2 [Rhododendron vialii]XP_058200916.1 11-beta-hydroxysteroid dehydrogenase 1A-like isoform X2 [Rhododendron vialii]